MPFWSRSSERPPQMYLVRRPRGRRAPSRDHHTPGQDIVPYDQDEADRDEGHAEGGRHEGHGGHGERGGHDRRRYRDEYGVPAGASETIP